MALTGAGLSTESGIPDYRSPNGSYSKGHKPVTHQEFVSDEYKRSRYWGRSLVGFERFHAARPNAGHLALARLEVDPAIGMQTVITQNVDGLHQKAGSRRVVELHGNMREVECLDCGHIMCRGEYTQWLKESNQMWYDDHVAPLNEAAAAAGGAAARDATLRADADADLETDFSGLVPPPCPACHTGMMKPNVVFFGANVPKETTAAVTAAVESSDGLLVAGSSLMVFSAFRLVKKAAAAGVPIAIVNIGETRADPAGALDSPTMRQQRKEQGSGHPSVALRLQAKCGSILPLACDSVLMRATHGDAQSLQQEVG